MTLRETITEELLNAVEHPEQLENISRTYSRSKGPYYAALLDATNQLQEQLDELLEEISDAIEQKAELGKQVSNLQEKENGLAEEVLVGEERLNEGNARLAEVQVLLNHAVDLERRGFGEEELSRLYEILGEVAASQGALPEEGVAQFFETVERYEQVVSLDLEARRAEARAAQVESEAERWETEAATRMAQSQARISVIDLVEDLLGKGIKGDDFIIWAAIIEKAGVSVEELAESLEAYGDVQALAAAREVRSEEIQTEITGLEAQVLALAQERDATHQAIIAVNDKALKQVKAAEEQARQHVDSLVRDATNYSYLKKEAEELGGLIGDAQLLRAGPESWKQLPRELVQHLLMVALSWAEVEGHDLQVALPAKLQRGSLLPSRTRLRLSELLLWVLTGLITEEERKAILARS